MDHDWHGEYLDAVEMFLSDGDFAVVFVDKQRRIRSCNETFLHLVGRRESVIGEQIGVLARFEQGLENIDWPAGRIELTFERADDSFEVVRFRVYPSQDGWILIGLEPVHLESTTMKRMAQLSNELVDLTRELHRRNAELVRSKQEIRTLRGILPICCGCKKIRDDQGHWRILEEYLVDHTHAEPSHGLCQDCLDRLYPETTDDDD